MKIVLDRVAKGSRNAALPPTSATFQTGEVTLARAETEQRPTVLGLIASGRMRPDAGTVSIDGATDYSAMRKRIALIDAPDVASRPPTSRSPASWPRSSCSPDVHPTRSRSTGRWRS
ncbi:hypothetical protein [Leifsonia poae]|uniref:hypothetical protein n=1 Tax=Leifsonia poae TaxID=110933 RepID=UPI003D66BAD8